MSEAQRGVAGRPWLVPIDADPETDREAWLLSRLAGIGGSDAAAVVGEHPDRSAIDVWRERTTGAVEMVGSDRGDVGALLEPTVLDWYSMGAPRWPRPGGWLTVVKPPSVYHRDRPWQRGSADGLTYLPESLEHLWHRRGDLSERDIVALAPPSALVEGVEVKTHGWFAGRTYTIGEDGTPIDVPPEKRIQCAWYMSLYDAPRWVLLALVDTHIRRTFVIERDKELEDTLLEQVDHFWRNHVLTGEPPPPDGTESYKRYLAARFKQNRGHLVETTPEIDRLIEAHIAIKREEGSLRVRKTKIANQLRAHIGDADGIRSRIGKVTWRLQPSGKMDEVAARKELYAVAGWTDDEIAAFEKRHACPDHRVLRTPK